MNAWHQRRVNAAEAVVADQTIDTRLKFYINLIMSNPKSPASPYANAIGIINNAMGLSYEEALHYIQNEITLCSQRSLR